MSIDSIISGWEQDGELEEIYTELATILTEVSFTKEQIATCFDTMKGGVYWLDAPENKGFTLEEYRASFSRRLKDKTAVVELCMGITSNVDRPEQEVLKDLNRSIDNCEWLNNLE